jgi:hypothetical protein
MDDVPLILEALPYERNGRGLFMVYETFEHAGISVPAGFVTDLASIPAIARMFLPVSGHVSKPAVLHDWLLQCGEVDHANTVFADTLREAGVSPVSRWLMVAAVRCYWWFKMLGSGSEYVR